MLSRKFSQIEHVQFAAARLHFLHVADHLLEDRVVRGERHHRHTLVDERDGAVLHLAGGIALGVDVGNLLELQGAFEGDGEIVLAAEEEEVLRVRILERDAFDLFVHACLFCIGAFGLFQGYLCKARYLAGIERAERSSLLVSASDKLHNARAIVSDLHRIGDALWARFTVSRDADTDEKGNVYFRCQIETDKAYLGTAEAPLPISTGMQATVDFVTGQKSVLDRLLRPIQRIRLEAFRER